MTGKEKIQAALSGNGAAECPVVLPYTGIFIRDHWKDLTQCPFWYQHSPELDCQLAWHREVIANTGQDWFELPGWFSRKTRKNISIEERSDGVYRKNKETGKEKKLSPPMASGQNDYDVAIKNGYSAAHPPFPATREEIEKAIPMPEELELETMQSDGSLDLAHALATGVAKDLFPLNHVTSPLWLCLGRWNFEDVMMRCITDPDLVDFACRRNLEVQKHAIRKSALLGAKGLWIEECMTDMVGPETYARMNSVYIKEMADEMRRHGLKSIYYFCGNPEGKWESILATGADAYAFEESKKNFFIDIEDVVQRVQGRAAVLGNLDAIGILPKADDPTLRDEIGRQVRAGKKNANRFIMSLGSPVTPGTSVERVRQYCRFTRELGG